MIRRLVLAALLAVAPFTSAFALNCSSNPFTLTNGATADATQVMANFNNLQNCANNNLAHNGANSDITSLSSLSTPLSVAQGGTGLATIPSGAVAVGNLTSVPTTLVLRSYLAGLTLSNDGVTPNTVLDIAAGAAMDSTNAAAMTLAAFTKSTGGAWAAGSGSTGMGQGLTIANSTWYDACLANNGGTPDIFFDTAVSGQTPCAQHRPTLITDTKVRRLGSVKTDGSAHLVTFVQQGGHFWLKTQVAEFAGAASTVSRTLLSCQLIPPGVTVIGLFTLEVGTTDDVLLTDPAITDSTPSGTNFTVIGNPAGAEAQVRTDTSARIGYRGVNGATITINTKGWFDFRGTDL